MATHRLNNIGLYCKSPGVKGQALFNSNVALRFTPSYPGPPEHELIWTWTASLRIPDNGLAPGLHLIQNKIPL